MFLPEAAKSAFGPFTLNIYQIATVLVPTTVHGVKTPLCAYCVGPPRIRPHCPCFKTSKKSEVKSKWEIRRRTVRVKDTSFQISRPWADIVDDEDFEPLEVGGGQSLPAIYRIWGRWWWKLREI